MRKRRCSCSHVATRLTAGRNGSFASFSGRCCWPGGAARPPRRGGAGRPAQKEPDRSYRMARYEGAALARQPSGWNDVSVQADTEITWMSALSHTALPTASSVEALQQQLQTL